MTHCNPQCLACHNARNSINGRYCEVLRRFVEHDKSPKCKPYK